MLITGNQRLIRHVNRTAILREIRKRPGISRTELAELTGLTRAAIGRLVDGLTKEGWLAEEPSQVSSSLGRRPTPLIFDESRLILLGAQLNGEHLWLVASTLSGEVLECSTELLRTREGTEALARLVKRIAGLQQRLAASGRTVCGLGVAVPGPVRPRDGVLLFSESTGWQDLPVRALLESGLAAEGLSGFPVVVERAVNCIALQHVESNRADLSDTLLYVHVGQSVAASVMLDGELLRGSQGLAGYVAHQSLSLGGPACTCGRTGCLHAMLTFEVLRTAFSLPASLSSQAITSAIGKAIAEGGQHAQDVMAELAFNLGNFLFNLCRIHDPARVFLGGAIFQLGADLFEGVQSRLDTLHENFALCGAQIQIMQVDQYTAARGAAVAMLRDLLKLGVAITSKV